MSTQAHQPVPEPQDNADEFRGAFGFFRKYQKLILYTAGLFALVTFSITGAMMGLFDRLFQQHGALPTIVVQGRAVELQPEDYEFGLVLARGSYQPAAVLPGLDVGDGSESERADMLAILRRAAIAEGIEVSDLEVEKAIEFALAGWKAQASAQGQQVADMTATALALRVGLGSLAQYRLVVKEAMRVGNYVRLQGLAVDGSDSAAMAQLLRGKEKLTLQVASLDVKAIEDGLRAGEAVTDEQLREFLDKMSEADRNLNQVYDTNRVSLQVGALEIAAMDPAQWQKELEGYTPTDEELQRFYSEDLETRYKVDPATWGSQGIHGPPPTHTPFEAEWVRAELHKAALANQAMQKLLQTLRDQRSEALKPANDALIAAIQARGLAQQAKDEAEARQKEKPDDQALKDDVAQKTTELAAKQLAADQADEALKAARLAWDFPAAFTAATAGRTGCRTAEVPGPKNADQLKDLGDLGQWSSPFIAVNVPNVGDLGAQVGRTTKVVMAFKVTEMIVRPLKEFDSIKDKLKETFYTTRAREQADAKKKALEDALLRLGKEKAGAAVPEIEGKRQGRIDEQMATWEKDVQARIDRAQTMVTGARPGSDAAATWQRQLDQAKAELAAKEAKLAEVTKSVDEAILAEVKAAARKHYAEIFTTAVQEAGFALQTLAPLRRDLTSLPRWSERYGEPAKFLWTGGGVAALKQGESTELVEDATNRKWYLALCEKVEPLTMADVERREYMQIVEQGLRTFRESRVADAISQSFTLEALKARYSFQARQQEATVAPGGAPR